VAPAPAVREHRPSGRSLGPAWDLAR